MTDSPHVFDIRALRVSARTRTGAIDIVKSVDLSVRSGEMVGIIGESGSGKTTTVRAALGLLDRNVRIDDGEISFLGETLWSPGRDQLRRARGRHVGMVFQTPTRSLNPLRTVRSQLHEVLRVLRPELSRDQREARILEVLAGVGFAGDPSRVLRSYPHELSGGMSQRVGIAMALAPEPGLLIADEPTSALDVTTQAEVVRLLRGVVQAERMALLFVTHDLMLAGTLCDRIVVMYDGRVVEEGPVDAVIGNPSHPYTQSLIAAIPSWRAREARVTTGTAPVASTLPLPDGTGCAFRSRCSFAFEACAEPPPLNAVSPTQFSRCHRVPVVLA